VILSGFSQKTGCGTVGGGESIELDALDPPRPRATVVYSVIRARWLINGVSAPV